MQLLLVISSLESGGAERVISRLATAWADRGWAVDLVTTHDGGRNPDYELSPRIRLHSVDPGPGPGRQFKTVRSLRAVIDDRRPDVVVSFLVFTNVLVLLATLGRRVPVVVSERLDPRVKRIGLVWSALRRLTYKRASRLVAQTPTAARQFAGYCPGGIVVIPNPVHPPGAADSPPAGNATDHQFILAMGRLHWQKGFDVALRAMSRLPDDRADLNLIILGEGDLRQELTKLRDEMGLTDRVTFPGRVDNPDPWLHSAQMFILPSRTEGFPNSLCEAMAAGLPVIAADCPSGPADIISHEVDGLLVPPGDDAALAETIARLASDESLQRQLGSEARGITDRYSPAMVLAAWDDLLESISGQTAPGGEDPWEQA